ncbi:MFS transporter [Promicromonospora sp. NPDC023805]|uniref:MFS transporter n=1 Tax=Promicromonospora sp. NPDC023805 TaxID=3154696 RepID=UPI0033F396B4
MTTTDVGGRSVSIATLLRRNADYRRVYISQVVSQGGDWFAMVPLITLLHQITGHGALGALLMGAETLVIAAMSPLAGSLVDRIDRRKVLLCCQIGSAAAVLLLLLVQTSATAWISIVTYAALAASKAFFSPTVSATVPRLVAPQELLTANAGIASLWGVMLTLGATFGGIAAAVTSPAVCFVINSLTFVLSAVLLARIPRDKLTRPGVPSSRAERLNLRRDLRQVAELGRADQRVLTLMFSKPGSHLGNGAIALFPAVAALVLHVDSVGASLLFAARGVGALLGPLVAQRLMTTAGNLRRSIAAAIALYGLGYLAFTLVGSLPLAIGFVVLAHVGGSMNATLSGYGLGAIVPDEIQGRTFAIDNMLAMLAIAVSQLGVAAAVLFVDEAVLTRILAAIVLAYAVVWWLGSRALAAGVDDPAGASADVQK